MKLLKTRQGQLSLLFVLVLLAPLVTFAADTAGRTSRRGLSSTALRAIQNLDEDPVKKLPIPILFGVRVADVRTINVRGKTKRFGRFYGKRSNWKKASSVNFCSNIVTSSIRWIGTTSPFKESADFKLFATKKKKYILYRSGQTLAGNPSGTVCRV